MDINKVRKLKHQLENEIETLVREFQEKTEVTVRDVRLVDRIDFETICNTGDNKKSVFSIEVEATI